MAHQEPTPDQHHSPAFTESLTYGGTSGHAPVDTSRDAITADDLNGVTAAAQRLAMILADQAGTRGITIAELREAKGALHHGKMSSALTNLHRDGRLVALRERRDKCGIYVLPKYAGERERRAYKPNRKPLDPEVVRGVLLNHGEGKLNDYGRWCSGCGWEPTREQPSVYLHMAQEVVEALS